MAEPYRVIVLGTGGNCIDIVEIMADLNDSLARPAYDCAGFLDDNPSLWGTRVAGLPVLGPLDAAARYQECMFVNGIGSPQSFVRKAEIVERTGLSDDRFLTLVHPAASVSRSARVGPGSVVFPNVTISSNARLGRHVIVLSNAVISHDVTIADHSCVAGGACISGAAHVGPLCYVGTNSTIIGSVRIGQGSLVGMGSVVLRDVEPGSVVVGNPARRLGATRGS
jgi:sugar O-acyltransferase (sialic acid O-acetyltransferase NeuD family)